MTALSHPPTVVVYGGTGFFGKLVVDDLLVRTTARIILAGRSKPRTASVNPRVTFTPSDLNDPASVRAALVGASVVVNCAGPYQSQGPALMHEAIASRVHYIDLAEDRAFVREAQRSHEAAKNAGVTLLSGLSVVPGLAALLARSIRDDFDELLSIRTFVAPGTRGSRGVATVRSLLSGVGRTLRLLREGRETIARGWSEPEWMEFPPPIGWRLQYLAQSRAGARRALPVAYRVSAFGSLGKPAADLLEVARPVWDRHWWGARGSNGNKKRTDGHTTNRAGG